MFELIFSRECTVATLELWCEAEATMVPQLHQQTDSRYIFWEYRKGLVRNYIDIDLIRLYTNKFAVRIENQPAFFDALESEFWAALAKMQDMGGARGRHDLNNLRQFYAAALTVWTNYTMPYWLVYFTNMRVRGAYQKRSERMRVAAEALIDDCDEYFCDYINAEAGADNSMKERVSIRSLISGGFNEFPDEFIYIDSYAYRGELGDVARGKGIEISIPTIAPGEDILGEGVCEGVVRGIARVCLCARDAMLLQPGEILVTSMTTPRFYERIGQSSAVVTDEGGATCHAAIVARQMNLPCVIGTKVATNAIRTGDMVEVNATHGRVRVIESQHS